MARAAGFSWDGGAETYVLARPLMRIAPRRRRREWRFEANGGQIYGERAAAEATDIEAEIRFATNPQRFLATLSERLGQSITYFEDRGGIVEYPATLIAVTPGDPAEWVEIAPDPERESHREYSARVRLRFANAADAAAVFSPYP